MSKYTIDTEKLAGLARFNSSENVRDIELKVSNWGFYPVDDWNYPHVNLPCWVLHWNLTHGIRIETGGRVLRPGPEKILLFPPFTRFSGCLEKNFIQFFIHFTAGPPFDRVRNELIRIPSEHLAENVLELEQFGTGTGLSLLLRKIVTDSLMRIPQRCFLPPEKTKLDSRIEQVIREIDSAPGKPWSVHGLAASAGMSVNNFHRQFLAGTDSTPKQYLLTKRLLFARDLLVFTEKSVDEIAVLSGFADRYHFSKSFKHYFDFPPVVYKTKIFSMTPEKRAELIRGFHSDPSREIQNRTSV